MGTEQKIKDLQTMIQAAAALAKQIADESQEKADYWQNEIDEFLRNGIEYNPNPDLCYGEYHKTANRAKYSEQIARRLESELEYSDLFKSVENL